MNPVGLLFLLFLAIPMVEIYFLIKVGGVIGALPTIALVVLTALLGAMLLRLQGISTLNKARVMMEQGQVPAVEMMEGVLLVLSGALLLTPGFVTDAVGFAFLIPPLRQALIRWFLGRATVSTRMSSGFSHQESVRPHKKHTIEGEYRREDD